MMKSMIRFLSLFILSLSLTLAQHDPHCNGKQVIVHLFEWKWTDIAKECERFLGPAGFCGVQTSPPHEHVVLSQDNYPWWQRYQPVSYTIESRSGNRQEFMNMVERCNAVGVRVFADVVFNHMAGMDREGLGSAGTPFSTMDGQHDFPGVPYSDEHFTPRELCPSDSGSVDNYSDPNNVRNCYLVGLSDLYGAHVYVQEKVADYLNDLISMGVAGFRVDAAKHMWVEDIEAIQGLLIPPPVKHGFPRDAAAFFYHEVIDRDDGAVRVQEYYDVGLVTEFRYSQKIAWAIFGDWGALGGLYDPGWYMSDPNRAFVFVDNHDNQRGHGGGGDVVMYQDGDTYKYAVCYMLAFDYGFTRVMSSYDFGTDTDMGPPDNGQPGSTADVIINTDGSCGGGWVCEHRWPAIAKMVPFRNAVAGSALDHFWSQGDAVGLARVGLGYFAMSKGRDLTTTVQTALPPGTYGNIIDDGATTVTVGSDGMADITLTGPDYILAICVGCVADGITTGSTGSPPGTTGSVDTSTPVQTVSTTTVTDSTVTTPTVQTTSPSTSSCCPQLTISSSGGISSNLPEYLGVYVQMDTGVDGTPIYKVQGSEKYLYFIDDTVHRFAGWLISSTPGSDAGEVSHEGRDDCIDGINSGWDYFFNGQWNSDETVNVACSGSQTCCSTLSFSSMGPILAGKPEVLGVYEATGDTTDEGRPVYKLTNADKYLYFINDTTYRFGGWKIADTPGSNAGDVSNEADNACIEGTNSGWEYFDGSSWVSDDTAQIECVNQCCQTLVAASAGEAGSRYPQLMGVYNFHSTNTDGTLIYKHELETEYLFYETDADFHWSGWMFTPDLNVIWGEMSNDGSETCAENLANTWDVFTGGQWIRDATMSVTCQ